MDKTFEQIIADHQSSQVHRLVYTWTNDAGTHSKAFLLAGYFDDTLANFRAMHREIMKDFPHVREENLICSKVTSGMYSGYLVAEFNIDATLPLPKGWEHSGSTINFFY